MFASSSVPVFGFLLISLLEVFVKRRLFGYGWECLGVVENPVMRLTINQILRVAYRIQGFSFHSPVGTRAKCFGPLDGQNVLMLLN